MGDRIAILLRHGDYRQLPDTPSAHQPFPLNDRGRQQAEEAIGLITEMIRQHGWRLGPDVHSSTLLRAWQTAKTVSDGLGHVDQIIQTDELAERGLGNGANLSRKQLEEIVANDPRYDELPQDWKRDSHFRLPLIGAESLMTAGRRVADYLSGIMGLLPSEDDADSAVLFVGHGGSFRHAAYHLGVLPFDDIAKLSMYHAMPVALAMSASGHWRHVAGRWKVRDRRELELD
jgi:2,3-bisphosphoglycerate-dependent phosphoglycerate mutase